jgi:hypothetical protein
MVWLIAIIIINSALFFFTDSLTPFFDMSPFPLQFVGILFGITYAAILCGFCWRLIVGACKMHMRN